MDSAFEAYLADPINTIYCIGSVVGPAPLPDDGPRLPAGRRHRGPRAVPRDDRASCPTCVVACVGGGSQRDGHLLRLPRRRERRALSASSRWGAAPSRASTPRRMTYGKPGHHPRLQVLPAAGRAGRARRRSTPSPAASTTPASGPSTAMLHDTGRVTYVTVHRRRVPSTRSSS
ncbi:MAG: hypothetical protein MZV63_06550 [Marinilabiliales bacterium]|nr:hypothetical protein [Marinilabiliales bacterium]